MSQNILMKGFLRCEGGEENQNTEWTSSSQIEAMEGDHISQCGREKSVKTSTQRR